MATSREIAGDIGTLLAEHRGGAVVLLDIAIQSGWTDWFVIATATSTTHLRGLAKAVDGYASERKLSVRGGSSIKDDEEWVLLDMGDVVIHLMSERARAFYELEKLWFQAEATTISAPQAPQELQAARPV